METTNEIMVIRKGRLKCFQVDDSTLSRLIRIRGNFYQDDPRLTLVKDLPEPITDNIVITPEMRQRAEHAAFVNRMMIAAGERSRAAVMPPQPERPKTPEELWQHDPALRAEFNNNFNAYLAYCKAVASGRCRIYGNA